MKKNSRRFGTVCCECLTISDFEVREKETKEECESMLKNYIKDTLKIDIGECHYNRIHRVGPEITNNNGEALEQVIIKFKVFSLRSWVDRDNKSKSNTSVY